MTVSKVKAIHLCPKYTVLLTLVLILLSAAGTKAGPLTGDFTDDGKVDNADLAILAYYWADDTCADSNNCEGADFEPNDGVVDINDLLSFSNCWLDEETFIAQANDIFYSTGPEDGRIWNIGGSSFGIGHRYIDTDYPPAALRLGDWVDEEQYSGYRDIVSFNTTDSSRIASMLPEDCNITSATLEVTCGYINYQNSPFNGWGGNCVIDIANPYFVDDGEFDNEELEDSDWQAPESVHDIARFLTEPTGTGEPMDSNEFSPEGLSYINTQGRTQLRFYFENSQNNDANIDCLGFYEGDYSVTSKRPKLKISYNFVTTRTPIAEFIGMDEDGAVYIDCNDSGFGDGVSGAAELRLGDLYSNPDSYEYRVILSFDTTLPSYIPADSNVIAARIELTATAGAVGDSPFNGWGGQCYIDVNSPYFGTDIETEAIDGYCGADASKAATCYMISEGGRQKLKSRFLDPNGLASINKNGTTQIRLYFENDTNHNPASDYLEFYASEAEDPNNRPKLIVEYLRSH